MGSLRAAGSLPAMVGVLLLASCALVKEEVPPVPVPESTGSVAENTDMAVVPAPAAAPGAGITESEPAAALAQEAARAKEQAKAEAQGEEAAAVQERPLSKEEVEARGSTMRRAPAARGAVVVEKKIPAEPVAAEAGKPGGAAPRVEVPASPYVFQVTTAPKDASHPFYGVGSKFGFVVNGVQGKELVLVRGKTYTFKVNTNVQHDFYISRSKTGWGAATYSKGVEGNFTYNGIVTITPDAATPDTLYYQCRNHKSMGGIIHVVNEGEDVAARKAAADRDKAAVAAAGRSEQARSISKDQVRQKLAFADMFINKSQAARRISGSGDVNAFEMYRAAQDKFKDSQSALDAGRLEQALALVDESLRLMSEASRRVPSEADQEGLRERYQELLEGVKTFEASYQRNYKRLSEQKHRKEIPRLDLDRIHDRVAEAERLADREDFADAVRVLSKVQEKLNTALTEMLHEETMSYELVFETPKDEYEYELARYLSYEELIPLAIEQRRPSQQTIELMNRFVAKAKGIKDQALPTAAQGDYKTAILMLQGATSHIQRALRLAGVR